MSRQLTLLRLCSWAWSYAVRHEWHLTSVLLLMAANVALEVVKPWPMVFLIDYVLKDEPMSGWLDTMVHLLPGTTERSHIVDWTVAAFVLLFAFEWILGLASKYVLVTLTQLM